MKDAHCYVVGCVGAFPCKDVPLWFLKLVPPPAVTTVGRPFKPLELLLEGTGGGILASPKGEDLGRLFSWAAEEDKDEDGGEVDAEVKATLVSTADVLGEVDEALTLLDEVDGCLRVDGGELLRLPKS